MKTFQLLNTEVSICGETRYLPPVDAFLHSYDNGLQKLPLPVEANLAIVVSTETGGLRRGLNGVPVHRSKHAYWNFAAQTIADEPRRWQWTTRRLDVSVSPDFSVATVFPWPDAIPAQIGEAAFHIARSFSIYQRNRRYQCLLHGSAIATAGGAVIFLGRSGAGKTTFLLGATERPDCHPLANDRVCVRLDDSREVISWPSYISLCEATIRSSPRLYQAAADSARTPAAYETLRWPETLSEVASPSIKRIYPPEWFTEAFGKKFVTHSKLACVCLLSPNRESDVALQRLDLDSPTHLAEIERAVSENSFDEHEPAFMPWHGLPMRSGEPSGWTRWVAEVRRQKLCVLRVNPLASPLRPYQENYAWLLERILEH